MKQFMKKAMLTLGLAALTMVAFAQETGLQAKVDLYLKDADLLTATRLLSQQTGLQFVIDNESAGKFGKINLSLDDVTAETAIKYLCQSAGGYAEQDENGIFVIRFGTKREPLAINSQIDDSKIIIRDIRIQQADPRDVYDMLMNGDVLDPDRIHREMRNLKQDSMPRVFGESPFASPDNFRGGVPASEQGAGLALPSSNQRGGGGGGGQLGGAGGGGQLGGGGGGGQLGGGGQGGGGSSFSGPNAGGTGLLPAGTTNLIYNPATNELIYQGTSQGYQELLDILSRIDKAPKQVTIKVEFVTTSQTMDKNFGIDWNYERGGIFAGSAPGRFASASDPVFLNYATGNVSMRLRTLLANGEGRVVTAPIVRTLNNQTAFLSSGTNTVLFVTSTQTGANGVTQTFTNPVTLTLGSTLLVRPRINGDDTITMTLNPNITTITGFRTGPDGQVVPETSFQQLSLAMRIKNGETVAIGGLTGKQDSLTQTRIPLLSDLPLIGHLFKKREVRQSSTELIVFVTPKIVDESTRGFGP